MVTAKLDDVRRRVDTLDLPDRLLAVGVVSGSIGAALTAGIGAAFLFVSLVCFAVVGLHVWAEVRE